MGASNAWRAVLLAQQAHIGGLRTFRPGLRVELDLLPLVERAVAGRLDRAEVHEDVFALFRADEAIALVSVEPLDGPDSHGCCPSLHHSEVTDQRRRDLADGKGQARAA